MQFPDNLDLDRLGQLASYLADQVQDQLEGEGRAEINIPQRLMIEFSGNTATALADELERRCLPVNSRIWTGPNHGGVISLSRQ